MLNVFTPHSYLIASDSKITISTTKYFYEHYNCIPKKTPKWINGILSVTNILVLLCFFFFFIMYISLETPL